MIIITIIEIDPATNRRSDQDDRYRNYREGYMPLMFSEPPNEYTMVKFDQPEINSEFVSIIKGLIEPLKAWAGR